MKRERARVVCISFEGCSGDQRIKKEAGFGLDCTRFVLTSSSNLIQAVCICLSWFNLS